MWWYTFKFGSASLRYRMSWFWYWGKRASGWAQQLELWPSSTVGVLRSFFAVQVTSDKFGTSSSNQNMDLFRGRWGTPGRWGSLLRWGNPPVHIIFALEAPFLCRLSALNASQPALPPSWSYVCVVRRPSFAPCAPKHSFFLRERVLHFAGSTLSASRPSFVLGNNIDITLPS